MFYKDSEDSGRMADWGAGQPAGESGLSAGQPDPSAVKQAQ